MKANPPGSNPAKIGNTSRSEIPNGAAAAAILSAGIGCFSVSLLGFLGDAIPRLAQGLNFYHPTGPLSGVTTVAILIWLLVWTVLTRAWRGKSLPLGRINGIAFLLLAVGLALSFPPLGDLLPGRK